jgi:hypothetical protein
MCAQCECKRILLQKCDKNIIKSWQRYIPKIGDEQIENNWEFCFYLNPLGS